MLPEAVDYLVVGSGIAGLWFAYRASGTGSVLLVTKKQDTESNTNYAQGGIASAFAEDDSPQKHFEDTVAASQGLADPETVRLVVNAGPGLVQELFELGISFVTYRDAQGRMRFDLGQEGGHHRRRIVHARDKTGYELEHGLINAVRARQNVLIAEQHFGLDLILDDNGRCIGMTVLDCASGRKELVRSRVTFLATGGLGQAYLHTTNPAIATGDGVAIAFRAGAAVANMEFIQFHPTALYNSDIEGRTFLVSEAVRGEGAILRTRDMSTFMEKYHPDGSLAPRDAVARAIDKELKRRGEEYVLLDATHLDPGRVRDRFPSIYETCLRFGTDITKQPIPVVPAAHYVCGGIAVNSWAETSVPGLFAAGECACSSLHGANRLASNSLLEALVFADRAARRASELPARRTSGSVQLPGAYRQKKEGDDEHAAEIRKELRRLMWNYAGIVRSDAGLKSAAERLAVLSEDRPWTERPLSVPCLETANLLCVAQLIVACARMRRESRGLHYNEDHPDQDEQYRKDTVVTREEGLG